MSIYWSVIRQGGDHLDAIIEHIWNGKHEPTKEPCPF